MFPYSCNISMISCKLTQLDQIPPLSLCYNHLLQPLPAALAALSQLSSSHHYWLQPLQNQFTSYHQNYSLISPSRQPQLYTHTVNKASNLPPDSIVSTILYSSSTVFYQSIVQYSSTEFQYSVQLQYSTVYRVLVYSTVN